MSVVDRVDNPFLVSHAGASVRVSDLLPHPSHPSPRPAGQVENELHTNDTAYVQWSGDMANKVLADVGNPPVIMCNGGALDPESSQAWVARVARVLLA
jgi:hypothetical protein